jgi:hypothetical protein
MKNKIVKITWEDSKFENQTWVYIDDEYSPNIALVNTVGYIVKENKSFITVASTISINKDLDVQACCVITIPKRCIVKKKFL